MKAIDFFLRPLGVVCSKETTVRKTIQIEQINEAVWDGHLQPLFEIPKEIAIDMFSIPFVEGNPYTETLLWYQKKQLAIYEESPLKAYYDYFCPESIRDVFWGQFKKKNSNGLFKYVLPWDSTEKTNNGKQLMYSGPMTEGMGKKEYRRLINVFNSINKSGYQPKRSSNLFNANYIQGYFLKKDNDYRFIVLHGKHRTASLIALDYKKIPVTFEIGKPRVVYRDTVEEWPQVMRRVFSKEEALFVFDSFFIKRGLLHYGFRE